MTTTPDISKYLQKKPVNIHWTQDKETKWQKKFLDDMSNFKNDFQKKLDFQFQQHIQSKRTPKTNPRNKVLSVENSGNQITNLNQKSVTMYDVVKNKTQNNDSNIENQDPNTPSSPTMYDMIKNKSNSKSNDVGTTFLNQNLSNNNGSKQKHRSSSGTGVVSGSKQKPRSSIKRSSSNTGVKKVVATPGPNDTNFVKNLTSDFKMQLTNTGPSPFKLKEKKSDNDDIKSQLFTNNNIQTPSTRGRVSTTKSRSRRPSINSATPRISQNYQDDEIQTTRHNDNVVFNMQDTLRILKLSQQKKEIKNFDQSQKIKVKSVNKIGRTQDILFLTQQGINECIKVSSYQNKDDFYNWVQSIINQ